MGCRVRGSGSRVTGRVRSCWECLGMGTGKGSLRERGREQYPPEMDSLLGSQEREQGQYREWEYHSEQDLLYSHR
uniref:Uncharacterized protein n=1 Tax=Arcella intermedia TaxID=1963864 RepID=A0A6B2LVS6_9EUKA